MLAFNSTNFYFLALLGCDGILSLRIPDLQLSATNCQTKHDRTFVLKTFKRNLKLNQKLSFLLQIDKRVRDLGSSYDSALSPHHLPYSSITIHIYIRPYILRTPPYPSTSIRYPTPQTPTPPTGMGSIVRRQELANWW